MDSKILQVCFILTEIFIAGVLSEYKGCFIENKRRRHMNVNPGDFDPNNLTPNICAVKCGILNYQYAGLTGGNFCFCSNQLPPNENSVAETECSTQCTGNPGEKCGSLDHTSVYQSSQPVVGLEVTKTPNNVIKVDDSVSFELSITSGIGAYYQFSYDDNAGRSPKNDSDMYQYTFRVPGEYRVMAYASDFNNTIPEAKAVTTVLVEDEVGPVFLECDDLCATHEYCSCVVKIYEGTTMLLTDTVQGTTNTAFAIADPIYDTVGFPIPSKGIVADNTHGPGTYILEFSEFRMEGKVLGFNIWAKMPGLITVLILQPDCVGQEYCSESNTCSASCLGYETQDCAAGSFCPTSKTCNPACSETPRVTIGGNIDMKYTIKQRVDVTLKSDFSYYSITDDIYVAPGDKMGFIQSGGGGVVARSNSAVTYEEDYVFLLKTTDPYLGTDNQTADSNRFLLNAVMSSPSLVYLHYEFTLAGTYAIISTVSNTYNQQINTTNVEVIEGINSTEIIAPMYVETNANVDFNLAPHSGSNVVYQFNFGMGDVNTTSLPITNSFTYAGVFNVTCEAFNELSKKSNFTEVIVEYKLVGLAVTSNPTATNVNTDFSFVMTSGSNFTCEWNYGDGSAVELKRDNETPTGGAVTTVQHTFTVPGTYDVNVTCFNHINKENVQLQQVIQDPVMNLGVNPAGADKNVPFTIRWTVSQGTAPVVEMKFNNVDFLEGATTNGFSSVSTTPIQTWESTQVPGLTVGIYDLRLTVSNLVSVESRNITFKVEAAMKNVIVTVSKTTVPTLEDITFTIDMTEGSSVNYIIDYGDGSMENKSIGEGIDWPGTKTYDHNYTEGKVYNASVIVWNAPGMKNYFFSILAIQSVNSVVMHNEIYYKFTPPAYPHFNFSATGTAPNGAEVFFDFGDGQDETRELVLDTNYDHEFRETGPYTVTANVSNSISSKTFTAQINIVEVLETLTLVTNPRHAAVNSAISLDVILYRAPSGPDCLINVDYGHPSIPKVINHQRTGKGQNGKDTLAPVTYSVPLGTYVITVDVVTPLETLQENHTIEVQDPVKPGFTVTFNPPSGDKFIHPGPVKFVINYTETPMPTDSTYEIDFGNGVEIQESFNSLIGTVPGSVQLPDHDMALDGTFDAKLTIRNLASSQTTLFRVGSYKPITGTNIDLSYKPLLPRDAPPKVGLDDEAGSFPRDRPVIFTMSHPDGTIELYDIFYTDGTTTQTANRTSSPFEIDFPGSGTYTVNVTASNPLYSSFGIAMVKILDRVVGVNITDLVPAVGSGVTKKFAIGFEIQGDNTCLVVEFGDGVTRSWADNAAHCTPYVTADKYQGALTGVTEIEHIYNKNDLFDIVATGYNSFSNSSMTINVPVSTAVCKHPKVGIEDQSFQFDNPMQATKGADSRIVGESDIHCSTTLNNKKSWKIEEVDYNTGDVIREVDISALETRQNAELYIPARFLDYGLYKATYSMEMISDSFDGGRYVASSYTLYKVVKSDLVGIIEKGGISEIVRGQSSRIELNPQMYSFDPDDSMPVGSQSFDSFTWNCTPANENATGAHCSSLIPVTSGSPINVDLTSGVSNADYKFCVVISKDSRQTTACLIVQVVDGTPPAVYLECAASSVCTQQAEGQLIPPSGRLGVNCECTGCTGTLEYEWTFYVYDYRWPWKDIRNLTKYVNDINSKELAITTDLFKDNPSVTRFRAACSARNVGQTNSGSAYMNFFINAGPSNGKCNVSKTEGTVSVNSEFCIFCDGWEDEQGIADYQIISRMKDDDVYREIISVTNFDQSVCIDLPMGAEYDNFYEYLYVNIRDKLGALTEDYVARVRVTPLSPEKSQALIQNFINSDFDDMDKTFAEADINKVTALTSNLVAILNSDSKKAQSEYSGVGVASSKTNTGFGPSDANRTGAFIESESASNPTANQKYEEEKDLRSKLKQQAIMALSSVTTSNVISIKQISSSLAEMLHYPEEVTLKSATAAINKTLDMAKYLSNMTGVTYENRKFAFVYMAATIGGAMDAIGFNGDNPSLTELAESKNLPEFKVYDTNWENTEGAIDANNFEAAVNQHQKHTHKNHAGQESSGFIEMATETMSLLTQGFSANSVPGEKIEFVTNRMQGIVTNQDAKSVLGNTVEIPNSKVELTVPDDINAIFPGSGKTENDSFVLSLLQSSSVPYQYSPNSNEVAADSNGLVIDIYDENGNIQVIKNLIKPVEFTIPRDKNAPIPKYKEADPLIVPWDRFYYHKMNLTKKGASIHVQFDITDQNAKFLVIVKLGELPDITEQKCDFVGVIPDESMPTQYRYTYFLDNRNVSDFIGSVYIGVRQIDDATESFQNYKTCSDIPQYEPGTGKPKKYNFRVFSTGCYFYNKTLGDWSTDGCWVGPKTDESLTHCFCTHLTTFAGGWVVVPNTIDWNFIFSNADFAKNPTLYITEIVIAVVYILAIIWARREDKKDIERVGVTPLKDNDVRDKYYYEVVVVTGMRRNAGTDSKVFFILSGEYDETDVRMFSDDKRKVFRRGAVDAFLVAVPRPLGNLNYARVWHDNSGKGKTASWYLKYLLVRDIQTNQRSVFICNKWFAVEEDDGQVDRVIPVAGKEQMTEFGYLFTERSRKSLVDGHLWFSVVARPAQSRFTRVQRVSCCLLLLFVSMLGNALFYGTATSSTSAVNLGPFALSPEQIFIGIAVNLIVFPINFLVMTLFRKSRARKMRPSRIAEALKKGGLSPATTDGDIKGDLGGVWMSRSPTMMGDSKRSGTSVSMRPETSFSSVSRMGDKNYESIRIEKKKKKKKFEFPWWCTILGWILLWLGVGVSVAFVTFYGITFQDEKCKKWITSMLMSFFTSVFITQPVKVFLTAIFFSLVVKNPGEEEEDEVEDEESHNLAEDEEYMHFDEGYGATRPRKIGYKPPDPAELERARIQRLNEIKMWEIIREIVFYAFFLWILMVISYRNRSPDAYFYKNSLVKTFIDNNDTKQWFSKIKNTEEFWNWAESGLVNGIRASNYYNSDPPLLLRGFVNDKVSRIMGYATMRQLRVQPGLCETRGVMSKVIKECNEPYSLTNEDEESYMPGWQHMNSSQTVNDTSLEWRFTKANVLNGYPYWGILELYGGGGYVVQLRGSKEILQDKFKLLESQGWIDRYTRGIFVEFTIYNPQVNLFAVATILAEFDRSGGVTTSYRFEPAMLLPYMSSVMLFQIACEVIYLLFTAWFIFKAVKNLFKERLQYFTAFWNIIELGIIAVSLGAVIVYFYRLVVTNELTAIFERSHGNEYMKFQYAGYWNEIFTYMIGWLVFFGTLKFLKLLRFNKRMALVAATLKNGSNSLIHFGIIFLIVYMAFMQLFYLTFMNLSTTFSTFITSMESGILMMMGKFDIYSMLMVEPFLTQLFVFGFVVTITFILVNMFLSILNETFGAVREDMNKVNNDYEIVDFMVGRFKRWTGIGGPATNTLQPSDMMTDSNGKPISGSLDNVNHFPDRIDRLLNSISNIYMDENGIAQRINQKQATYDKSNMKSMIRGHGSKHGLTEVQN